MEDIFPSTETPEWVMQLAIIPAFRGDQELGTISRCQISHPKDVNGKFDRSRLASSRRADGTWRLEAEIFPARPAESLAMQRRSQIRWISLPFCKGV
ncbi:hypothetical protein J7T55_015378 [Diaporthe amygdali]|uniref:uncharacterized protein n=1 Tax=Phomopsis amygdali TaxID=1214568 RepID=UPI0022FEE24B|nr:uncharacterized protein J7T55_015378 [Diaporthe amygdali]KAJ0120647.1 hypothetical protein J7T55_015378 [Diaporthe amygdali]